jgi:hypothetical protein
MGMACHETPEQPPPPWVEAPALYTVLADHFAWYAQRLAASGDKAGALDLIQQAGVMQAAVLKATLGEVPRL